jgi:hypothetical protein
LRTQPLPKVNKEFRKSCHDQMRDFHHLPL